MAVLIPDGPQRELREASRAVSDTLGILNKRVQELSGAMEQAIEGLAADAERLRAAMRIAKGGHNER